MFSPEMDRWVSLSQSLREQVVELKANWALFHGKPPILGFTASCFDLLHAGHCLMLKDASQHCDFLIVAVQSDPTLDRPTKSKPVMTFEERKILVKSNRHVNKVIEYSTEAELLQILKDVNPDIRFLGTDYLGRTDFTGYDLGIPIHYSDRSHGYSTSELRVRVVQASFCQK